MKEDKERQTRDLGAFFEEVGALDELGDAVEEDEEAQRERTDRAVQMSYMVRLARLYQQADRGATTTSSSSALTVAESEELILLGDYSSSSLIEESVQQVKDNNKKATIKTKMEVADTDTTGVENDVFSVMKKQRLERKRLREMARIDDDDDDNNADTSAASVTTVYDWTTKSV